MYAGSPLSCRELHLIALLQLSDQSGGRDFDADDEEHIRELAALVGEALDALRAASSIS
jgi:GAF domain-containing protein